MLLALIVTTNSRVLPVAVPVCLALWVSGCPFFIEAKAEIFRYHLRNSKYLSTFLFKKSDGLCFLLFKNWNSPKISELRVAKRKPEKVLVDVEEVQKLLTRSA
jgi:hypothetical protein